MGSVHKQIIVSILLLSLLFGFCSCSKSGKNETTTKRESDFKVSEFDKANDEDMKPYLSYVESCVKDYYKAVLADKSRLPNLPLPMSANLREYLKIKFDYETKLEKKNEKDKKYAGGAFNVFDYEIQDNRLVCIVVAEVNYRYSAEEAPIYMVEEVQVVIENPQSPTIIDWYVNDPESFDSLVRGEDLLLSESENLLINQDFEKIKEKAKDLIASIK